MKRVLLGAAIALAGGAQLAHADTTGVVDLAYRNVDTSGSSNLDGVVAGGSVVTSISSTWDAQFDAHLMRLSASGMDETITNGTAHAYYNGGAWKLGGFVSGESLLGEGIYGLGVDGQYNFSQASLTGQIAYDSADNSGGDGWAISGVGRYFFTDNLSVNAHYAHLSVNGAGLGFGNQDVNTYGAGGEYKFDASPVSLFVDYQDANPDGTGADLKTFSIGVRYGFGDGTLAQREKTGPSLLSNAIISEDVF